MPILFYAFYAKRVPLCKTFDVIIPFSPVLYNTLLHFHHSNILRSHLALAEHDVPYLGHLCRRQRVAGGHHGQVSPAGLQKAEAVGKAFRLDQRFYLIFCVEVFEVGSQLLGITFFSPRRKGPEVLRVFWIVSIASS